MIKKSDLQNKYIFWDIDGTLAEYRFNDRILTEENIEYWKNELKNGIFIKRPASKHMQKIISECNAKEHIIMGHYCNDEEVADKNLWLDNNYPMIKRRPFTPVNESKANAIIKFCKENNIELNDVVFVDDTIHILKEAESKGIRSYHISSFLDWDYQ